MMTWIWFAAFVTVYGLGTFDVWGKLLHVSLMTGTKPSNWKLVLLASLWPVAAAERLWRFARALALAVMIRRQQRLESERK